MSARAGIMWGSSQNGVSRHRTNAPVSSFLLSMLASPLSAAPGPPTSLSTSTHSHRFSSKAKEAAADGKPTTGTRRD